VKAISWQLTPVWKNGAGHDISMPRWVIFPLGYMEPYEGIDIEEAKRLIAIREARE
jgi:hypothetical protein